MSANTVSAFFQRAMLTVFLALLAAALVLSRDSNALFLAVPAALLLWFFLPRITAAVSKLGALRLWLVLTVLCLVVKGLWILLVQVPPAGDYATYWNFATCLAVRDGPLRINTRYMALFPHIFGYAWVLNLLIRVFGDSLMLASVFNVFLSACSGSFLFLICRRLGGLPAAVAAYLLWIVCPSQTIYNSLILSDPLYTALILGLFLWITCLARPGKPLRRPLLTGLLAGAGMGLLLRSVNAVRPVSPILILALLLWLFCLQPDRMSHKHERKLWLPLLAAALAVYMATGPLWNAYFTYRANEAPATVTGFNVLVGFNQESSGKWNQADSDFLVSRNLPDRTATEVQQEMLDAAVARITSGEIDFPLLFARKLAVFLGSDAACVSYSSTALRHTDLFTLLCNAFYYALLLLAILGAVQFWRSRDRSPLQLAPIYILGLTLAHMLVEVAGRYHYSIIPMLILTAQAAFQYHEPPTQLLSRFIKRRKDELSQ